jgi:hypothetical protein
MSSSYALICIIYAYLSTGNVANILIGLFFSLVSTKRAALAISNIRERLRLRGERLEGGG